MYVYISTTTTQPTQEARYAPGLIRELCDEPPHTRLVPYGGRSLGNELNTIYA